MDTSSVVASNLSTKKNSLKNKNNGKVNKVKASSPIKCDDKPSSFIKTFCRIGLKTHSTIEENGGHGDKEEDVNSDNGC